MTKARRPRFTFPILLLRDALGRFVRLRFPVVAERRRTRRRRPTLPVFVQLALF